MGTESGNGDSRLVSGLLKTVVVVLAAGDLMWFILTFPTYFRWFPNAWISSALPLVLLWGFIGLPSLLLGLMMMRISRHRAGAVLKLAFLVILVICALVPLLASFAHWTATPGAAFPRTLWIVVLLLAMAVGFAGLWGASPPKAAPAPDPSGPDR
ncbi:MAG TPA: hypothetical protein VFT46_08300 [Holophagaceae bacterium]|nr:hypothetical protein [Holophagaceae bacterium]